jgi:ADP-ribose pyrophosphatase YjhB (NUDIX family)
MIGGLVDPGEDYAEAVIREAREETAVVVKDVRWVWSRERIMQWRDRQVLHRERFFLGRSASTAIDTSGLDEREKSWTLDHRWWGADEIAASSERFEPVDLGARLKALLRDGPPKEPIDIGLDSSGTAGLRPLS